MARKRTNDYINNEQLNHHLSIYTTSYKKAKVNHTELPKIPEYVGESILLIARKLATKSNFGGYSYREEMIGDGVENCLRYLHNYNPEKTKNAFGYLTLIMWRAFVRRIQREQQESYTRHKMILNNSDVFESILDEMGSSMLDSVSLEKSSEIVRTFEERMIKKKEKADGTSSADN